MLHVVLHHIQLAITFQCNQVHDHTGQNTHPPSLQKSLLIIHLIESKFSEMLVILRSAGKDQYSTKKLQLITTKVSRCSYLVKTFDNCQRYDN